MRIIDELEEYVHVHGLSALFSGERMVDRQVVKYEVGRIANPDKRDYIHDMREGKSRCRKLIEMSRISWAWWYESRDFRG